MAGRLGAGVSIGYYDQAQDNLDDSKTIFDEISDAYPDLNNTKIRNTLAAFLFYCFLIHFVRFIFQMLLRLSKANLSVKNHQREISF